MWGNSGGSVSTSISSGGENRLGCSGSVKDISELGFRLRNGLSMPMLLLLLWEKDSKLTSLPRSVSTVHREEELTSISDPSSFEKSSDFRLDMM